jgi:D-alanyl-D-alanine dipeptidase
MVRAGFKPLKEEWWHFSLETEPFPDQYFDFPLE